MTAPTAEKELAEMLLKILNRSSDAGKDSCEMPMKKVRTALLDEASELLAKHGY